MMSDRDYDYLIHVDDDGVPLPACSDGNNLKQIRLIRKSAYDDLLTLATEMAEALENFNVEEIKSIGQDLWCDEYDLKEVRDALAKWAEFNETTKE
jgi:hypothetical protein